MAAATNRAATGWPGGENRGTCGRRPNKRRQTKDWESSDKRVGNNCKVSRNGDTDQKRMKTWRTTATRTEPNAETNVPGELTPLN